MSGQRLRLTTSRPAGYRRGGQVIGGAAAPAFIGPGDVTPEQMLAILRDPNIAVALETDEGVFRALTAEERSEIEERAEDAMGLFNEPEQDLPPPPAAEPNTAEPQIAGTEPANEASGADASQLAGPADASAGSAADAGTNEPTAQPDPPAPEPAPPVRAGGAKPKPVKAKP